MLLQIFDEGRLADAKGRSVDFRNTIIIMTSNLAQKMLKSEAALGFRATTATVGILAGRGRRPEPERGLAPQHLLRGVARPAHAGGAEVSRAALRVRRPA